MDLFSNDRPDKEALVAESTELADQPRGPIPAWSFSTLKSFEECPYRVYLSKVKKLKGEGSEAADRGTRIHDEAEAFIRGEMDRLPKDLKKMEQTYVDLQDQFDKNPERFQLEEDWGFTARWGKTGYFDNDVWLRQKLDVFEKWDTSCVISDHKSGRKHGNELKHADQGLQYAIGAFKRYPELDFAKVQFLYIDHNEEMVKNYTRERAIKFLPRLEQRAFALTNATEQQLIKPNPSKNNCRFCDHAKSGACKWGQK